MQLFILGATGYIGSAVAKHALQAGHTVRGLARSEQAEDLLRQRGIIPVRERLEDSERLAHHAHESDAIVFAVSYGDDVSASMRIHSTAINTILSTIAGSNKVFMYSSGVGVYGDTGIRVVNEDEPPNPDPLFAPLLQVEQDILHAASRNVRGVVIRAAQVYGGGGGGSAPFVRLIDTARQMGHAVYIKQGTNEWSTVHLDDLANLYVLALEQAPAGTLLNAAAGMPVPMKDIAVAVGHAAGLVELPQSLTLDEASAVFGPFMTGFLSRNMRVSGDRATSLLAWRPKEPTLLDDLSHGSYRSSLTR